MSNEILKLCRTCNQKKTLESFSNHKREKDGKYYECKDCKNNKHKDYSKKFRKTEKYKVVRQSEKYKVYHQDYIKKYQKTEKHKEYQKYFWQLNTTKEFKKNQTQNLDYDYLRDTLRKKGFLLEQIKNNPEILEVQKLIIKTKRLCKTSQN
jgi:hypothetical protein